MGQVQTESQIHKIVVEYLTLRGFTFLHIPNEGKRSLHERHRQAALGLSPGAPDLLIFDQPQTGPKYGPYRGVAMELKTSTGKVSPAQERWLNRLAALNWYTCVPRSSRQAIDQLRLLYPFSLHKGNNSGDDAPDSRDEGSDDPAPDKPT